MKVVYLISAFFAYLQVFIESFAFVVLCLIIGFAWDMTTSGAGLAPMLLFVIQTFFEGDIDPITAKGWAIGASSLFAFLLVGALYTASRNKQAVKAVMLGLASLAISFLGITKGMFNCFPFDPCWTIHDWQNLLFSLTMSIVPIITYSTAAVIINNKFGDTLKEVNDKIVARINRSIKTAIENMGDLEDIKTKADVAKATGKATKKKQQAEKRYGTEKSNTMIGTSNVDNALESIMNNFNNN